VLAGLVFWFSEHKEAQQISANISARWEPDGIVERWLVYRYFGGEFAPLSKPFKTKEQAEKAREKHPERERKTIGIGVIRIKR
jgi:hypothetical protein